MSILLRIRDACANGQKYDAINELKKLLDSAPEVQFGKIGRRINEGRMLDLKASASTMPERIYLLRTIKGLPNLFRAKLIDVSYKQFQGVPYPPYYNSIEEVTTWFKVRDLEEVQCNLLENFILEASGAPLSRGLKGMSTVFYVRTVEPFQHVDSLLHHGT